jgi:hypothetical protein
MWSAWGRAAGWRRFFAGEEDAEFGDGGHQRGEEHHGGVLVDAVTIRSDTRCSTSTNGMMSRKPGARGPPVIFAGRPYGGLRS